MIEMRAVDARDRFDEMLARVEAGETVTITRDGRTVARLEPDKPSEKLIEPDRPRAQDVADTLARIKELRSSIKTRTTVDEILAWRHEGHKY